MLKPIANTKTKSLNFKQVLDKARQLYLRLIFLIQIWLIQKGKKNEIKMGREREEGEERKT